MKLTYDLIGLKLVILGCILSAVFLNAETIIAEVIGSAVFFLEVAAQLVILAGILRLCSSGIRFKRARNSAILVITLEVIMMLLLLIVNGGDWQNWMLEDFDLSSPMPAVSLILLITAGIALLVCTYNLLYGCRDIAVRQGDTQFAEKCKKAWLTYLCGLLFSSLLEELSDQMEYFFWLSEATLVVSIIVDLVVSIWVLLVFNQTYKSFHGQEIKELDDESKRLPEDSRGSEQHRG